MRSISSSLIALSGVVLFSHADTAGYYEWFVRWFAMLMIAVGFLAWIIGGRGNKENEWVRENFPARSKPKR